MGSDGDQADGTHSHPGQSQTVVTAVVVQIGSCHNLGGGTKVGLGILNRNNALNLGKTAVGFRGNRNTGATRNVIEHNGGLSCLCNGGEVRVHARLGRLVVVRGHDQQAVHTNFFCTVCQLKSVGGIVRTHTSNNLCASADSVFHDLEDALILVVGHGGVFTGGAANHQAVVAVVDQVVRQVRHLLFVHGAIRGEGGYHSGQEATEDGFNKGTGI